MKIIDTSIGDLLPEKCTSVSESTDRITSKEKVLS